MAGNAAPPSLVPEAQTDKSWTPAQNYTTLMSPNASILTELGQQHSSDSNDTSTQGAPDKVQYMDLLHKAKSIEQGGASIETASTDEQAATPSHQSADAASRPCGSFSGNKAEGFYVLLLASLSKVCCSAKAQGGTCR
jgi:hypothetical protein